MYKKKKKTGKSRKKSDKQKLKEQLWELCKTYVRLRDENTCQRCLKEVHGSNAHTSHVIPKSHGNILKFDDQNLKLLCGFCHLRWWHKNPLDAAEWFKSEFPGRWKYIQKQKNKILKLSIYDLNELIDEYTDLIVGLTI